MSKMSIIIPNKEYEYRGMRLIRRSRFDGREGSERVILEWAITYNKSEYQAQKDLEKWRAENPNANGTPGSIFTSEESFSADGYDFEDVAQEACRMIDEFYKSHPHLEG